MIYFHIFFSDYRLTLKDALEMSLSIFKEATKKCMLSPSAQINKRVESHLSKIAQANDSQMDTISKKFVQQCWSSVTAGDDKIPAAKGFEQICSHFHKAACKPNMEVLNLLTNLIGENDSSIGRIYQLLLHHTTTEILNKRFGPSTTDMTTVDSLNTVTLNKSEEQALRYACGYIPYSLTKHFRKFPKNEFAVATVSAMQKWHCNSEIESKNSKETDSATESSFMAYTKTWIDLINRGKLFEVSDETYRFFHAAEVVVKDYLNVKRLKKLSKVDSVKDELMKLLLKNRAVLLTWSVLTEKVNEQVADKLKERVLKKFVDMRCSSFCSVYLTCKKMSNPESVSSRGEKSLRVQLVGK